MATGQALAVPSAPSRGGAHNPPGSWLTTQNEPQDRKSRQRGKQQRRKNTTKSKISYLKSLVTRTDCQRRRFWKGGSSRQSEERRTVTWRMLRANEKPKRKALLRPEAPGWED